MRDTRKMVGGLLRATAAAAMLLSGPSQGALAQTTVSAANADQAAMVGTGPGSPEIPAQLPGSADRPLATRVSGGGGTRPATRGGTKAATRATNAGGANGVAQAQAHASAQAKANANAHSAVMGHAATAATKAATAATKAATAATKAATTGTVTAATGVTGGTVTNTATMTRG